MHISLDQLRASISALRDVHPFFGMTFLAFKKVGLPVGYTIPLNFAQVNREHLEEYYRPLQNIESFYSPFHTAKSGWVSGEHSRTTLQRIAKDTFGDAFIHASGSKNWGWRGNYIRRLQKKLEGARIPLFALVVWLYRDIDWPQRTSPEDLFDRFEDEFRIQTDERPLFERTIAPTPFWLAEHKYTISELIEVLGSPPGAPPQTGAALAFLEIQDVGPAKSFRYEPGERVNLITGDNSLGKSFLLDGIWFALTGEWVECKLLPRRMTSKNRALIRFGLATPRRSKDFVVRYDWEHQQWFSTAPPEALPGLVIYGRFDGSFSVWDSAKAPGRLGTSNLHFHQRDIWDGLLDRDHRTKLCNGLIQDVALWQISPARYQVQYSALVAALRKLSPSPEQQLELADPVRLPRDSREIPALRLPYGSTPIIHASAGVQRIVALAYIMVWAWREHVESSRSSNRDPQHRIVLIIDEIEAHLHPRWQRVIVPALMAAIRELETEAEPQIHIATHSPLVLASLETFFDDTKDTLYTLELQGNEVKLEETAFVARGRADYWLMSDVFGLSQARSLPAEGAIQRAKALQEEDASDRERIARVHEELKQTLAQDDEFWPRWLFWAAQRGVE